MKSLTFVLKITAIALNTYFSAWLLLFVCSGYGGHPLSLYDWVGRILVLAIPPVTLITIALTFQKKFKILTSVIRIIAIILNAHLLIHLIWFQHEILDDMALWAYLIYCGLPALNLVALAVTFIKVKEKTPPVCHSCEGRNPDEIRQPATENCRLSTGNCQLATGNCFLYQHLPSQERL